MDKYDIELINKIIEISKKILKIYNTLYELEVNNKKESDLYNNSLKYLDLLLELEDELYKKIKNNKIDSYIIYSDRGNLFKDFSDFTLIINDFNDNFVYKRVYNRLINIDKSNLIKNYQENVRNKKEPFFDLNTLLYQVIHEDMLNSFVYETNNISQKVDNLDYKNGLIMIKYLVSFLNKNIDKIYKNGFNNNNKLCITNKAFADTFNVNENDYFNTFKYYYFNMINKEIKNINKNDLYTTDYAWNNYRTLLQNCLIRAFYNITSDNIYLNTLIHDIISNEDINNYLIKDKNIILLRSERLELYGSSK